MTGTNPSELVRMYRCLKYNPSIPDEWEPHLFRCRKESKAPLKNMSWKSKRAALTIKEAVGWMKKGYNIGIAGRSDDPLLLVDKDDPDAFDVPIITFSVRTRGRKGSHYYFFARDPIPNIPVEGVGEVRSQWQYCLAPGSYVPTPESEVPEGEEKNAGKYTVETPVIIKWINNYVDLPEVFLNQLLENEKNKKEARGKTGFDPKEAEGDYSALFNLQVKDIVKFFDKKVKEGDRWTLDPSDSDFEPVFHSISSHTDANMSIGYKTKDKNGKKVDAPGGILHCWRHGVAHGAIQVLAVLSGYMGCLEAGTPHRDINAGPSKVVGDDGAIFHPLPDPVKALVSTFLSNLLSATKVSFRNGVLLQRNRR